MEVTPSLGPGGAGGLPEKQQRSRTQLLTGSWAEPPCGGPTSSSKLFPPQ